MPTVLLVDVSLSLAHALQGEVFETYKEFMQEGLLYLIQELETNHPLELVSLITFSSTGKVLVPFSRNFNALKTALLNIRLEDKTSVLTGVKAAISSVSKTFGTTVPVQIIVVTNGCKLGGEPDLLAIDIPFPAKLHVVAYLYSMHSLNFLISNLRDFFDTSRYGEKARVDTELLTALTWKTKGYFQFLELPQAASLMRQAFSALLEAHLAPTTQQLPPLLLVLHDILRAERLTAVARIDEQTPGTKEWFCLINSIVAEDTTPSTPVGTISNPSPSHGLALSVLTHNAGYALGLADLVALPEPETTQSHVGTHVSQMLSAAGRPQHPKSYNIAASMKESILIGLNPEALIPDCSKIIRYAKSGKIELLYSECEKIRQTARTYSCSDLLREMLIEELHVEKIMDTVEGLGNPVIDLIKLLPNHSTEMPIIYREKAFPTPTGPPTSMSIHSLINN